MLRKETIEKLNNLQGKWCVSLYLPIYQTKLQENRTRLKKLMFEAEKKLLELGTPLVTVAKMLLPIERILDNNLFWKNKTGGLAIFIAPESFNLHSLKDRYKESAIVSNQFYLKPLIN